MVLRHVDTLDGPRLRGGGGDLQEASRLGDPAVGGGDGRHRLGAGTAWARRWAKLLRLFPGTVAIPPLRHHIEDLQRLVPFLLARLGHGGR